MPNISWLMSIAFGIPAFIVAQALVRNWLRWKAPRRSRVSTGEMQHSGTEPVFHLAEFNALKSEVAEIIKAASANFQYAAVGSAAIFTWIATSNRSMDHQPIFNINPELLPLTLWIPFLLAALFFSLSSALYIRLSEMARYLRRLEDALGLKDLGWEKEYSAHPGTIGPLYFYGWVCLLAGNWFLALHLAPLK
jgi:hypothetical protein